MPYFKYFLHFILMGGATMLAIWRAFVLVRDAMRLTTPGLHIPDGAEQPGCLKEMLWVAVFAILIILDSLVDRL